MKKPLGKSDVILAGAFYYASTERLQRLGDFNVMNRVGVWVRKYRAMGVASFKDRRGEPFKTETEQERELHRLQLEVDVLKSGYKS